MLNKIKLKIKNNTEIVALGLLLIITIISTSYYNFIKKKVYTNYKTTINNIYLKKTVNHIFDNLEPKFKKIEHKVTTGETFDNILKNYKVNEDEIKNIKTKLSEKTNLDKLKTDQKIKFTIDQTNNLVKEFVLQISKKEKIYLSRNSETNNFSQKIIFTKLKKEIIYKENLILKSLYKSAIDQKIPANTIIEFARIYGFQVDFQRDIKKKDSFQIMYEIFTNDKGKTIETGNILFANLKLSG